MSLIQVSGVTVRRDADGRFRLNDLHKAAGGEKRHNPSYWLANQQTAELIATLTEDPQTTGNPVVSTEGRNGGTFACKELVYAYAMWVNPQFHLHVIRTFDRVATSQIQSAREENQRRAARERARLECPAMTGALRDMRAEQGKTTAAHHYRNEADMLNRIVLGMAAADYRELHGIDSDDPIRDHLSAAEIAAIEELQRFDSSLILLGMDYSERKARCTELFQRRHSAKIEAESIKRLN